MFKKGQYSNNIRSTYEDLLRGISRIFQIVLKGREMGDFTGEIFFIRWWEPEE